MTPVVAHPAHSAKAGRELMENASGTAGCEGGHEDPVSRPAQGHSLPQASLHHTQYRQVAMLMKLKSNTVTLKCVPNVR